MLLSSLHLLTLVFSAWHYRPISPRTENCYSPQYHPRMLADLIEDMPAKKQNFEVLAKKEFRGHFRTASQVIIAVNSRSAGSLGIEEEMWGGREWCTHGLQLEGVFQFQSLSSCTQYGIDVRFWTEWWQGFPTFVVQDYNTFLLLLTAVPKYLNIILKFVFLTCKYFLQSPFLNYCCTKHDYNSNKF